ncbi:MAG: efflux RND transporter permease subunit [Phycisphaerales bacterium]|nr:MAG: efflux RND transporter permease subunit [Phycisphaerales bacterium]
MLRNLIRFSVENASLVIVVAILSIGFAAYAVPRMAVDVFPELNAPTVTIMTESAGYAADEVEQYVTFPIESAVNGLPGVRRVRSASAIGLSIVWVEFDWGVDIYRARYLVSERMTLAEERLPPDVHSEITPVTSITGEIMLISLRSPDGSVSPLDVRAFGEFELRNRLLSVPGVSQVVAIGGELPEYQVDVDQERLRLYDLTIKDVVQAAGQAHSTAGGGYLLNVDGMEIPLRQTGRVQSVEDIRSTVIRYSEGTPVTIGQIADVQMGPALKRGTASDAGNPAVVLSVQKAPGTNTLALTDAVDEVLDSVETALPSGLKLNRYIFRQSDFINLSLHNVLAVARDAAVIVAVVLVLFLMNVRTTMITLTAIPLSVAVALLMLWGWGETINAMTLGGLAVAIGVVVDDGIIGVENVYRRLREDRNLPPGERKPQREIVFAASNEIRSSIMFATLIIVVAFVPMLFLQGLEGRFFRPLGIMYILSISASLLVALTVTPALARVLLRGRVGKTERETVAIRWLKTVYRPALSLVLKYCKTTVTAALALIVASIWLAGTFGTSFLPEFNEGTFTVFVMAPPGTSLAESDRIAQGIEQRLARIDGVCSVVRRTGRAERDEHAEPVSNSEIDVTVEAGYEKAAVRRRIDDVLSAVPGMTTTIGQPIEHRVSHIMSGTPASIAINVYGEDLRVLRKIARDIETAIVPLPGARDVTANREIMITSLPIRYRHDELARWGLTPVDAAEQVRDAIFGETVAVVNDGVNVYDLVVRLAPEHRQRIEQVKDLMLRGVDGKLVRLDEVADVGIEKASNLISRENARRKAVISCNVAARFNLGDLVEEVRQRVDPIVADYGYAVSYGGQFEAQQSASNTLYVMGAGVAVIMLLLLNMSFGSSRAAMLVMVNLPLALIGGIIAIFVAESDSLWRNTLALFGIGGRYEAPVISIASMVGFITLFGIAVRNGILLVNHYAYLMQEEGVSLGEAVFRGSQERLVPILMTALTAVVGLVPIAWAAGEPGSEILAPMAIVVLGGLVSSTLLNLLVVPAGYALIFRGLRVKTT